MRVLARLAGPVRRLAARRFATAATLEPPQDREREGPKPMDPKVVVAVLAAGGGALVAAYWYGEQKRAQPTALVAEDTLVKPAVPSHWPLYTRDEVALHTTPETGIWVTYLDGVFDVTKFVQEHPGGDKILLAAGAGLEPFWELYAVHKNQESIKILETLRIGSLHASEIEEIESVDPFANEPQRHNELIVLSEKPFNAEAPYRKLADKFITPTDYFYIRNHLPVPEVDISSFELEICCPDKGKLTKLSYHDLKTQFKPVTVTVAVQCAGNRRDGINKVRKTRGLTWNLGAISNATWTGPRLRDVLIAMGITDENKGEFSDVIFEGMDQDPTGAYYGTSIPINKAMSRDEDVILAYQMNGEPLTRDHGYPVRAIVPGIVGARNVKWLQKIEVSKHESDSHWQQNDYKLFSPSTDWDTVDFSSAPAIQEGNVQSAICTPLEGDVIPKSAQTLRVSGYAWSGGGRGIVRVDVTADGGKTWHVARLEQADQDKRRMWAWSLWHIDLPIPAEARSQGQVEVICKATDVSYNVQPDTADGIWNVRGCLNNSWHRVPVVFQ